MKELLEKTINNYWNQIDDEGTYKTFCEIYEKTGDEEAEFYMGKMLYLGIGTGKNWEKAYQIMEKLYDRDRKAREVIADMYYTGKYLEEDDKKAFDIYTQLMEDGEDTWGYSTFMLGICYKDGIGTEINLDRAFELIKKATELGYKDAYYYLGRAYYVGEGVEKNLEKAFEYTKKSAELEDEQAYFWLGYMYFYGEGTEINYEEAIKWLTKSVKTGKKAAQFILGNLYIQGKENGIDIEENKEYGLELLLKVTENREEDEDYSFVFARAVEKLEELAYNGEQYVVDKLKELVEAGKDPIGAYSSILGNCYQFEYGVEKDLKKAFELYKNAVELGFEEASFRLGQAYFYGDGTEVNEEKGIELYKVAANWDENAQYVLGMLYLAGKENGVNIEENKEYGLELIIKSARNGYENAISKIEELAQKENDILIKKITELAENKEDNEGYYNYLLGQFYQWGFGVEIDYQKAFNYYETAVELGCYKAYYRVGYAYLEGKVVEKDLEKAFSYMKEGADRGDSEADYWIYGLTQGKDLNDEEKLKWVELAANAGMSLA